jgi:hypothetical protein
MSKIEIIEPFFTKWENDVQRAEELMNDKNYFIEGLIVVVCYIGALGALRYQGEKDWKAYKDIISNYSGYTDTFENIDLLLFYQFKISKLANENIYKKLNNYDEIFKIIESEYGNAESIKTSNTRYIKKEGLCDLIKSKNQPWFNEPNFLEHIQLFSNNQILYKYARCEAVHNADFPLFNISSCITTGETTYRDNHQVDRKIILSSLRNIVSNLKSECLDKYSFPWEL